MAASTRMARGPLQRLLIAQQKTSWASAGTRQYCNFPNQRNVKLSGSFQNASLRGSGKQLGLLPMLRPFSHRSCGPEHFSWGLLKRQSLFGQTLSLAYSTRPDRNRVKGLMVATYISAAIGGLLLTAVGFRFYGRFKKRARGIEEVDCPLYGRRSRVFCRYRGYIIPSSVIDTVVYDVPRFEVRPDDVWVVSFPKAGTTWLQEIVYLISTDYDYDKARATIVVDRFPYLEFPYPGLRVVAEKPSPRFIKSHLPFSLLPKQLEEKKPKVIYIARNPKDTVVSLLAFNKLINFTTFLGTMDDFAQLFVDGTAIYGPWLKHVREGWEHRNDDNVLFITYEELQKDFCGTVRAIAKFLEKPLSESQLRQLEQHCSFDNMRNNDSVNYSWNCGIWSDGEFLRKGEVGDWKNHLSPEMSAKFDAMVASLEPLGLHVQDS